MTNQTGVIWTVIIASTILLSGMFLMTNSVKNSVPDVPTAEEIAGLILIPEAPQDEGLMNRLCELTNGCNYWEPEDWQVTGILNSFFPSDDFEKEFADLLGFDEDDFTFVGTNPATFSYTDYYEGHQIRAYSDEDKDDENWEVKVFLRVVYHDNDKPVGDNEVVYVVASGVLDEGEYNSDLKLEEVDRNFEFE